MKNKKRRTEPILISYITLQRVIGILGITFPFIMIIGSICCGGCSEIQSSISAYYHTNMRNIFIGYLCTMALFLFAYKGYESKDDIAGNLASFFAFGVVFFPTSIVDTFTRCIPYRIDNPIFHNIHIFCAAGFLLTLAYFSLFLFTIKDKNKKTTKMKKRRNVLYKVVGIIMLSCIFLIFIYLASHNCGHLQDLKKYKPVFWLETIALCSFGVSWLIKGKTLLTDKKDK